MEQLQTHPFNPNGIQIDDITWGGSNQGIGGTRILQIPDAFSALFPSETLITTGAVTPHSGNGTGTTFNNVTCYLYGADSNYKGGLYLRENVAQLAGPTKNIQPDDNIAANMIINIEWRTWRNPTADISVNDL